MRWDYGSIYKEIRASKSISQSEVCGEMITRSTLSKFEHNISMPRYEHMAFLLEQLDMSFSEFHYICNNYFPSEKQQILIDFDNLTSVINEKKIDNLIEKCKNFLKINNSLPIQNILEILNIYATLESSNDVSDNSSNNLALQLWKKIEKSDTWYYTDIKKIDLILFFIPIESIEAIVEKLLVRLKKYKNYRDIQPLYLSILMNLSTKYLYSGYKIKCKAIIQNLLPLSKEYKRYDYFFFAKFRLAICNSNRTDAEVALHLIQQLEEDTLYNFGKDEFNKFLQ